MQILGHTGLLSVVVSISPQISIMMDQHSKFPRGIKTEFVSEVQTDPEGVKWVIKNL